ncbi:sulfatase-like hydrolase/transferase [Flavobacterium sp. MMLR14_040]|uniref:sulfatase-like hydrolase/transferase n=1 Tax=Flavobacterium sp. MMLR14_040 TaxID=3093843 RepID=UPI00298FA5E1|nr:sulfatase-like hydrolase/transferase [Flavobacterium sp. MMLR14_040]MDW8851703.1 sulfatase-like hydrolase/transferase [Flavobacterium sp. MMLR14_040]
MASFKRIKKILIPILLVLFIAVLFLFWPINTNGKLIEPDKKLVEGKTAFLAQKDTSKSSEKKPNIIILLADDLGKYDISLYGGKATPTPQIDSLAASGVTFTDGYVSSSICSPSRAGLLTGRYQERFGHEYQPGDRYPKNNLEYYAFKYLINTNSWRLNQKIEYPNEASIATQGLPQSEITFADLAKKQGYATAIIGKWHLGHNKGFFPLNRGFDYHYGFYQAFSLYTPEDDNPDIINHHHKDFTDKTIWGNGRVGIGQIRRDTTIIKNKAYLTETFADEAEAFIDKNKTKPFLLYVPFNAPHTPFQVRKKYYDRFPNVKDENKRVYFAMISALDDAIGRIVAKVKKEGLEENTLIIFASDNGGADYTFATTNAPLKGGKFSHFEGGINVPFALSWKGKIKPHTVYKTPVSSLDIFSTIAAVTHSGLPKDRVYDGVDLISTVNNNTEAHKNLYWRSGDAKAIRSGDWKLIISGKTHEEWLYNLANDKSETTDLAQKNPAKVKELHAALQNWEKGLVKPLWPNLTYYEFDFGKQKYFVDL